MERPELPKDGVCKCGSASWYDVEEGYVRWSTAHLEDGVLRVYMDGWDDMSENGDGDRYVRCQACDAQYAYAGPMSYS